MCYSAQVHEAYRKFIRRWGATLSLREFADLYGFRQQDRRIRIPRAIDRWFDDPANDDERAVRALIDEYDEAEATRLEQELFAQKTRLNAARRSLESKVTKKAQEDVRIAGNKIKAAERKLKDLRRDAVSADDRRWFPGWYVPVIYVEDGETRVAPMRYQCRPAGKPAAYDQRYPGTYNARRDNLEGFWRAQFGHTHALIVADVFFENVEADGRNRVLKFEPRDGEPILIACLWSRWTDPRGEQPDLLSFAAVTDDPEPEVAAAGHDRTIINIKPEHVESWLNPRGDLAAMYAIMDDKQHPYYEHRVAA